ncbi:MAG TPA: hypothetical protein VMB50_00540 [Myxococcales bacterium]|nr:hypothetical protein [Myxococcales bacterium]
MRALAPVLLALASCPSLPSICGSAGAACASDADCCTGNLCAAASCAEIASTVDGGGTGSEERGTSGAGSSNGSGLSVGGCQNILGCFGTSGSGSSGGGLASTGGSTGGCAGGCQPEPVGSPCQGYLDCTSWVCASGVCACGFGPCTTGADCCGGECAGGACVTVDAGDSLGDAGSQEIDGGQPEDAGSVGDAGPPAPDGGGGISDAGGTNDGGSPIDCPSSIDPTEYDACPSTTCGAGLACVEDAIFATTVCEYGCVTTSDCPDILSICSAGQCTLNECTDYGGTCSADGWEDGTCVADLVPLPDGGAEFVGFGLCLQGGSSPGSCDGATEPSRCPSTALLCPAGWACDTASTCLQLCQPGTTGGCPGGKSCVVIDGYDGECQ